MASSTSSAAVAALVQKASQQYVECRRKVTAKVDEVKALDQEINALFAQITALGENAETSKSTKSVGRLEVRIAGVEGETPVENAVITVALDPEYESDSDEFEIVEVQHVIEKHTVTVTKVNAEGEDEVVAEKVITKEDGVEVGVEVIKEDEHSDSEDAGEHTEHAGGKRKTTTKITRTTQTKKIKKKVEKKEPVVRSVEWTPEVADSAFPATFVFDPVQSREAVVTITVAPAAADEPEAEPVKEIEFPVSSLFQGKDLDQWYTIKEEVAAAVEAETEVEVESDEETTITELAEEEKVEVAAVEAVEAEAVVEKEDGEEVAVTTEEAAVEVAVESEVETEKVEVEASEVVAEAATVVVEEAETAVDAAAAAPTPAVTRFHVQATFVLSEIEALSIEAVNLSKKKQEAEAVLAILEREAASLRTKYERLNASQRSLGSSSVSKPKSNLLMGRNFAGQSATIVQKSSFQKAKDSISAVLTPQRQQVVISVAMFFGSAVLFHFQGENLLA
ncbi:hypothetical protein Gpo141_00006742 [Globisporangium polare]